MSWAGHTSRCVHVWGAPSPTDSPFSFTALPHAPAHHPPTQPVLGAVFENPLLATFTAAWFKVMLNGDRDTYYDLIFGTGPDALCSSEPMVGCYTVNAPPKGAPQLNRAHN